MLMLSMVLPEPVLREQPPSLRTEREDGQGLTRLFSYAPASPFRKEEGGQRHAARGALQKYLQVICQTRSRLIGSKGSMPPSDGIPLHNRSCWSRKCRRVPREHSPSLGHVSDVPRVIPHSACSKAAVEPFWGQPTNP
jgi:hypothetical protein